MSPLNEYSDLEDNESPDQLATQRDEISTNPEPPLLTNTNVEGRKTEKDKVDKAFPEYFKTKISSRAPTPEKMSPMSLQPDVHKLPENNLRVVKINV